MRRLLTGFFLLCFFFAAVFVHAQEEDLNDINDELANEELADAENDEDVDADIAEDELATEILPPEPLPPELAHLEMEIRTSSLMELAAWARELGLSDGGTREEIAARLRFHYGLPSPTGTHAVEQRVVTIESATTTEYFTIEAVDEEFARFRGNVVISLIDGNSVHRIRAGEILFNRTRNVLTASGGVEYHREEGNVVETFRGETITVNLDNWASLFIDGVSERTMAGTPTAYRFAGTIISRDAEGATLLRRAEITNPANEEAFWSITASRLWLLPGNDFAILNAVLRVGNIPLLYIPFFFFPADQVVFRPVLGVRTREGTFFQTTTYLLGRPRTEAITESSIAMIFGGADEDQETRLEGIFLRTTGERRQDPSDVRLALLFDTYVNMGFYLGTELSLPGRGPFGEFSLFAGVGFTRDVYLINGVHTPFYDFDGVSNWNRSLLFFMDVPFRYRFRMTGSFRTGFGNLTWDFPLYSDPFVDRDFMRRPPPRDWLSMVRELAEGTDEHEEGRDSFLGSYAWTIGGSFSFPVRAVSPVITSLSISHISSSMSFVVRHLPRDPQSSHWGLPNPTDAFFHPQTFTMYSFAASIAGSPISLGATPPRTLTPLPSDQAPGLALLPDRPISPWATDEETAEDPSADAPSFSPPVLGQTFNIRTAAGPRFLVSYRLAPTTSAEMQFNSSDWNDPDDVDWSDISTIMSRFRTAGNLDFDLSPAGAGAYSFRLGFTGTASWQETVYLNEEAGEFTDAAGNPVQARIDAVRDRDRRETFFTSDWTLTSRINPFFQSAVWGNTNLQHNVRGRLADNRFDVEAGERDWTFGAWDRDNIRAHTLSATVEANVMDHTQRVTVATELAPLVETARLDAQFNKWISTTTIRTSVREPWDDSQREFGNLYVTERLTFTPRTNFEQHVVFNIEDNQYTTLTSRFNTGGFSVSYSVRYAVPWRWNPLWTPGGGGAESPWTQQNVGGEPFTPVLEPHELALRYNLLFARDNLWGRRFGFAVNFDTGMAFDLQRYTNSRLDFIMTVDARIVNFMTLSFRTRSENAVLFRYFRNMPFFDSLPVDPWQGQGEDNFFVDLINSFRFDNPELRERSGFNLRDISVSLIHHLGDWNATLTVHSIPFAEPGGEFRFRNDVSFLIQWVPIAEIRTDIRYTEQRLRVR